MSKKAPRRIIFHLPRVSSCVAMYLLWHDEKTPEQNKILEEHLKKIRCPNYEDKCICWPNPVICQYNKPRGCWTPELIKQVSPQFWQQRYYSYKCNRKLTFTNRPLSR